MSRWIFYAIPFVAWQGHAQSLSFYAESYRYDETPLMLHGVLGEWTEHQSIQIDNNSGQEINISAHLHRQLPFIYFIDRQNNSGNEIELDIPNGYSYELKVIANLENEHPMVYNDKIGLDITYQSGATSYLEILTSVYFYTSSSLNTSKPEGYNFWGIGGYVRVVDSSSLPLKVYSNHTQHGVSSGWNEIIKKAINTWNNAGKSIGLKSDYFTLTSNSSEADLKIDWSGNNVPVGALGAARLTDTNPSRIIGISLLPPGSDNSLRTAEVLIQELGHILGLAHSTNPNDIMNGHAHPLHHEDLSKISLTSRDRQMLSWLYAQKHYIPIVSGRKTH